MHVSDLLECLAFNLSGAYELARDEVALNTKSPDHVAGIEHAINSVAYGLLDAGILRFDKRDAFVARCLEFYDE